jgi:hypothetical protein
MNPATTLRLEIQLFRWTEGCIHISTYTDTDGASPQHWRVSLQVTLFPLGKLAGTSPKTLTYPPESPCIGFVEGHTEHVNTLCGPKVELCNVKPYGKYTKHKVF